MNNDSDSFIPGEISLVDKAIGFAARAHDGQKRKIGYRMPYIAHPFGVAMILQQMGCAETVVAAGLLHDVVEDTKLTIADVRTYFGNEVADIVAACTEPPKYKYSWEERKSRMVASLVKAPLEVKLVVAADKFHNLSHTLSMVRNQSENIWTRFGRDEYSQAWYYRSIYKSITANVPDPDRYSILGRLKAVIDALFEGIPSKPPGMR